MLHLGAVLPNLAFSADAHYHHLTDDIIAGGKLPYRNGTIAVPDGPGLGIELDRGELGGYTYDRDPGRPGWFALVPNDRTGFADPAASIVPAL
jgi:glucarate dehydratase